MESKNELKKIDIKNNACCYFDYIIKVIDINLRDVLLDENNEKILSFITFHTKLLWIQYHCVLRWMN